MLHIVYEIEHLSTSGGIERILTDKANHIADVWGWDVTIIVLLEEDERPFYPLSPKVRVEYLHVKTKGILMCIQALWRLNKAVSRLKPDVYVTMQSIGAISCLFNTHRTPSIYEAHGIRPCMPHPLAITMAERYADVVVTLTHRNAGRYPHARCTVTIPNFSNLRPTDSNYFTLEQRLEDCKSCHHCIAVGRLDYGKDFQRLLTIWAEVSKRHPDWILDIYGDGPEREALERQAERLGISRTAIFHGKAKDMAQAYQSSAINLLTSRFEGFGLVLIEAAQCGIPSVAFNCDDGPSEIIRSGKNGYLVPMDNDHEMISCICRLIENPEERLTMGNAAKTDAQRFGKTVIMEQWKKLFCDLAPLRR